MPIARLPGPILSWRSSL